MNMLTTLYITLAQAAKPVADGAVDAAAAAAAAAAKAPPPPPPVPLSTSGWIMMLTAISVVTISFAWLILKVMTTPNADDKIHAPLEIDTRDKDT